MPIFCRKNVHPFINNLFSCNYLHIFQEKTQAVMPIFLVKKRGFYQNYTILWDKKWIGYHFSNFYEKITALIPRFCKKRLFSKNILLSCHFFQILHEKSPAAMPTFGPKNVNFIKRTLYYGPKKSIRCLFCPILMKKLPLALIFCHKNVHSQKRQFSHAHILLRNIHSLKNTMLSCHFLTFVMKTPCCLGPIWSTKRQICHN